MIRGHARQLSVAARCAYMAVQDLCLLANGEPALWLPGSGPVSVPFAFEVINRTLVSYHVLFTTRPPFRFLLRERACAPCISEVVVLLAQNRRVHTTHQDGRGFVHMNSHRS